MAVQPTNRKSEQNPTAGKIVRTPAPDAIDNIRSPSGVGQGQNGPQNRSWSEVGHRTVSPLGLNMEQSQADSEDVLSKVIAGSVTGRRVDAITGDAVDWQRRNVSDTAYPTTFGCEGAKPGPKMPGAVDTTAIAQPVRKPR